jgi:hypothetical protein
MILDYSKMNKLGINHGPICQDGIEFNLRWHERNGNHAGCKVFLSDQWAQLSAPKSRYGWVVPFIDDAAILKSSEHIYFKSYLFYRCGR